MSINILCAADTERGHQLSAINQITKQHVGNTELISSTDMNTLQAIVTPDTDVEQPLNKPRQHLT